MNELIELREDTSYDEESIGKRKNLNNRNSLNEKSKEIIFRAVDEKGMVLGNNLASGGASPNRVVKATDFRAFGEPASPNKSRLKSPPISSKL